MASSKENMLLARISSEAVIIVTRSIILHLISTKGYSLCLYSSSLCVSMDMVKIVRTPSVDHFERGAALNVDHCVYCLSCIQVEAYPRVKRLRDA